MEEQKETNDSNLYKCICCNYNTTDKSKMIRHNKSAKHLKIQIIYDTKQKEIEIKQQKEANKLQKQEQQKLNEEKKKADKLQKEANKLHKEEADKLQKEADKLQKEADKLHKEEANKLQKEADKLQKEADKKLKEEKKEADKLKAEADKLIIVPYDILDLTYNNIKKHITFKFTNEICKDTYYINLLIKLKDCEYTNCMRVNGNNIELYEHRDNDKGWYCEQIGADEFDDYTYNYTDICRVLIDITESCCLLSEHKYQKQARQYDLYNNHLLRGRIMRVLNNKSHIVLQEMNNFQEKNEEKIMKERVENPSIDEKVDDPILLNVI